MNILIVGAGAIGGYFGGRLLEIKRDVTFLVREKRKASLEASGLKIVSNHGNSIQNPKLITKNINTGETYDLIILSTKSYHLEQAIKDILLLRHAHEQNIPVPILETIYTKLSLYENSRN
ncbi:hypothetical protein JSQ81_04225 [Sporosarcina sp. Marseille-Q4063]|uniref:2-dehydropantoate 2-reductase N-terminal domain-containing protein n=1 Tax=Sporosarcina sp. Marseille-Q4063 TaxID=2810514 RepID=UPI001BAFC88B|nr:2-dehydropantoate 2-reductase N-terminal domain-containing protein [Sporosarcina sp. Marseille-Q4063]QUW22799.1 hypothetical protein JSQ81_04225 [Sporosarcina sp. Marseille-Q4063]